jgi:hypothetical protein
MIESPERSTPKTPFGVHFEPLLPVSTGRRFYAGFWDGWQWSRFREHLLAAGAMWGRSLDDIPETEVITELRRWGIRDVLVWSPAAREFFARSSHLSRVWGSGDWEHFALAQADTRPVVTENGSGTLDNLDPLGGRVVLKDVAAGAQAVVRTNYYPVWSARVESVEVPLFAVDGQLAFRAPRSGSYEVRLDYPRRVGVMIGAGIALCAGLVAMYFAQGWHSRDVRRVRQQQ